MTLTLLLANACTTLYAAWWIGKNRILGAMVNEGSLVSLGSFLGLPKKAKNDSRVFCRVYFLEAGPVQNHARRKVALH